MKVFILLLGTLLATLTLSQGYYSTKLAQKMVQFSSISYESPSDIVSWECDFCKVVAFEDPIVINNGSVFGYVGYSP